MLKDKRSSDTELLKKLGTVSLYDQRIMKITSCVFKVLNNDIPSTLKDLPLRRSTTHNLCGKGILTLRKVNSTNNGLRSWRYLAPKTWNMWPEALKYESKLNSFKRRLKKENLLTYYLPTHPPTYPLINDKYHLLVLFSRERASRAYTAATISTQRHTREKNSCASTWSQVSTLRYWKTPRISKNTKSLS